MNIFSSILMLLAPLTYSPSGFNSWMVVYWSATFEAFIYYHFSNSVFTNAKNPIVTITPNWTKNISNIIFILTYPHCMGSIDHYKNNNSACILNIF